MTVVAGNNPSNELVAGRGLSDLPAWEQFQVKRELAGEGSKTVQQIAEAHGISYGGLRKWKHDHKAEIAVIAADLANPFAGLWIADKANRIDAYMRDADRLEHADDVTYAEAARTRATILKQVAEELGQLPGRVSLVVQPVIHVIEGVDVEALK